MAGIYAIVETTRYGWVSAHTLGLGAAAFGFQVLSTLYMQRVLGYGPAAAGLGCSPRRR